MAARVTKRLWEIGDIVQVLEAWKESGKQAARPESMQTLMEHYSRGAAKGRPK